MVWNIPVKYKSFSNKSISPINATLTGISTLDLKKHSSQKNKNKKQTNQPVKCNIRLLELFIIVYFRTRPEIQDTQWDSHSLWSTSLAC